MKLSQLMKKLIMLIMSIFILFFSISLSPYPFAFIIAEDKVESNPLDSLTVKFMNIGSGDCILIKQGNTEIMIDAGDVSETNKNNDLDKPSDIVNEIKQLCSDGKLEYLIVTHGDADHIVNIPTILDEIEGYIEIGNWVDFQSSVHKNLYGSKSSKKLYGSQTFVDYVETRSKWTGKDELGLGDDVGRTKYLTIDKWFEECKANDIIPSKTNEDEEKTDLSVVLFQDVISGFKIRLLYNQIHFENITSNINAYTNVISVCVGLEFGQSKVLLCGDLEEYTTKGDLTLNGEKNLLANNGKFLQDVTLYKASHHGSRSSNSTELIETIKPKYVAISGVAGSTSITEPSPEQSLHKFLDIDANICITSKEEKIYNAQEKAYTGKKVVPYYGRLIYTLDKEGNVSVACSNDEIEVDGLPQPISETEWGKNNYYALKTTVFSGMKKQKNNDGIELESSTISHLGQCTLVQYKHYDILIDCGVKIAQGNQDKDSVYNIFVNKVKQLSTDGIIEYLIITSCEHDYISQLVNNGIFKEFDVKNVLYPSSFYNNDGVSKRLLNEIKTEGSQRFTPDTFPAQGVELTENTSDENALTIKLLENDYYGKSNDSEKWSSGLGVVVSYQNKNLLFLGGLDNQGVDSIVSNNKDELSDVVFYRVNRYGDNAYDNLLNSLTAKEKYAVISTNAGDRLHTGTELLSDSVINALNGAFGQNVYLTTYVEKNRYYESCGDITFKMIGEGSELDYLIDGTRSYENISNYIVG